MSDSPEIMDPGAETPVELNPYSLLEMFDELSFSEKWERVSRGLKLPKDTGEYKWARLQMLRLSAPIAAVVMPIFAVLLLLIFSAMRPEKESVIQVTVMEPEETPELDEIKVDETPPPEPPEPVEVEEISNDFVGPADNTAISPGPDADYSPTPAPFDAVAIVKSPVIMKGIYGSRSPGHRGSALGRFGGSGKTEGAVLRALRWLKLNQQSDGSWKNCKPAMTSLALLTYLAHGETPSSEEFGPTVEKAIRFLLDNQKADGRFTGADSHDYTHPIASYALSEAYGLTRVPTIKYAAEKAIMEVIRGQNASGGFNYNLKPCERDDTSYMAWCAQSLKAAKMAGLFDSDSENHDKLDKAMKKAIDGFKKNYSGGDGYGGFGYTSPGVSGLTGAGTLCMQLLGAARSAEVRGSLGTLAKDTFSFADPQLDFYYHYYSTQAKFLEGGNTWSSWNDIFSPELVKNQQIQPNAIADANGKMVDVGSWKTPKGHTDGIVQDTCLATLMLEVYYRYLPTFQTPVDEAVDVAAPKQNQDLDIKISL